MPALTYLHKQYSYKNDDAMEKVLHYSTGDTISYGTQIADGSCDLISGYSNMLSQMQGVQGTHRNENNIGKRVIHAQLRFDKQDLLAVGNHPELLSGYCDLVSHYYHCIGFQNHYGLSVLPDGSALADFTINSVNYITRKKLVCTRALESEHNYTLNLYYSIFTSDKRL